MDRFELDPPWFSAVNWTAAMANACADPDADTQPCDPASLDDDADEDYDDAKDHTRCPDCKGSGFYVGFRGRDLCQTCDGAGWI
jgi:hypothetical protein